MPSRVAKSNTIPMASQLKKATASSSAAVASGETATGKKGKNYKRSRAGCFTCRLRRKKCDEILPRCRACKNLGLECEYERPSWWGSMEARRINKEDVKVKIKERKTEQNAAAQANAHTNGSKVGTLNGQNLTPSLHESSSYYDLNRQRSVSVESQYSTGEFDFNSVSSVDEYGSSYSSHHSLPGTFGAQLCLSPGYEYETKAERQLYFNDHLAANSSVSSFSSYHHSIDGFNSVPVFPGETWLQDDFDGHHSTLLSTGPIIDNYTTSVFDFSNSGMMAMATPLLVDPEDQRLLNHFNEHVVRLIFPILELNQPGQARAQMIMPALESNKCFMHCSLAIAALHMKTTRNLQNEIIDGDISKHTSATISELCMSLNLNNEHNHNVEPVMYQILEAALAMIIFYTCVGRMHDEIPDLPNLAWHQHFQVVTDVVSKLNLPYELGQVTSLEQKQPPFNMTLAAWVDILGATMLGRSPFFADTYREKHLSASPSGLSELMGCDDRVMYVISEIACLEGLKLSGQISDMLVCQHVASLGMQLDYSEPIDGKLEWPYTATGEIQPAQLGRNISAVFRLAARIYLCSLVTLFDRHDPQIQALVDRLTDAVTLIPQGLEGYDRAIVWPLLMGGYVATVGSKFRTTFDERVRCLGEQAEFGSFGRMATILRETWKLADTTKPDAHWRDVTEANKWDFLLI